CINASFCFQLSVSVTAAGAVLWCDFINQFASTGTNVCANKYEVIIEKAIANASGKNSEPGIPPIVKAGANTAKIQNRISSFGKAISLQASHMASAFGLPMAMC